MFIKELAFIKDLKRSEKKASGGVKPLNIVKASESMANLFNSLFDFFSLLILAFFVNIP